MTLDTNKLLTDYYEWLKANYKVNKLDDSDEIVTPLLDNLGDNLTIYLTSCGDNHIKLDDDGYTINNLEMMNITLSETRKSIIDSICKQHDVQLDQEQVLSVSGAVNDFPLLKLHLTTAMIKIGDILFTQRKNVQRMFAEDVIQFLKTSDLGGMPNQFRGRSGIEYQFPYVIPNKGSHKLKMVDTVNHVSTNEMMQTAFKFWDIRNNSNFDYPDPEYFVIYDNNESRLSSNASKIARDAGVRTLPWDDKDNITKALSA